jgi:hypothetical protein
MKTLTLTADGAIDYDAMGESTLDLLLHLNRARKFGPVADSRGQLLQRLATVSSPDGPLTTKYFPRGYFIKSKAGERIARGLGLHVRRGRRYMSYNGERSSYQDGWVVYTWLSRRDLDRLGLIVSSTHFMGLY